MPTTSRHECATQAADLVVYLKELKQASLYPFPEDENEVCLILLGKKLHDIGRKMPSREACRECGFVASAWKDKLDAIETNLSSLLRRFMAEVERGLSEALGWSDGSQANFI